MLDWPSRLTALRYLLTQVPLTRTGGLLVILTPPQAVSLARLLNFDDKDAETVEDLDSFTVATALYGVDVTIWFKSGHFFKYNISRDGEVT